MFKIFLKFIVNKFFKNLLNFFLKKNNIVILFRSGSAIGDHVYMSSIVREISTKLNKKIILFTNYYEFFINNPRIYKLFRIKKKNILWFFLNNMRCETILEFRSIHKDINNKHFLYYHKKKRIHLAQAMSEHFNLNIDYEDLKNEIFFSKKEIIMYEKKINLPKKFAVIHSSSKSNYTNNKEWKVEGMQKIVKYFDKINWLQLGIENDPKLSNCTHLLNLNFRELAYVISKCDFLITYEGLFNHIASCFNKKNFLIHLGFLPVEAFNYKNNIVIERNKYLECYPCFSLVCEFHKKFIKNYFDEKFVIESIEKNLEKI